MKSIHDYRGEHRAALKRYRRALRVFNSLSPRTFRSKAAYHDANRASYDVTAAYTRLFKAEVAHREGIVLP